MDCQLIDTLQPVSEAGAALYYPFFANTYPIAFHFMHAARTPRSDGTAAISHIRQIPWGTPIDWIIKSATEKGYPALFYATEHDAGQRTKDILNKEVCIYQPGWIFTEQSPHALDVAATHQDFNSSTVAWLLDGRRHIDVHTDIPEQARAILAALEITAERYDLHITDEAANRNMLPCQPSSGSANLYFYGGPLTAYLRRKHLRYVPFRLPPDLAGKQRGLFSTHICITPKVEDLLDALVSYHATLFNEARTLNVDAFWALCNGYNRSARSQQQRATFNSAREYVECLRDHLETRPAAPPDVVTQQLVQRPTHSLSLFGCGNLSIGLVLPALRRDISITIIQVLREPNGGSVDWSRVASLGRLKLRAWSDASIQDNYHEEFEVIKSRDVIAKGAQWRPPRRSIVLADTWENALRVGAHSNCLGTSLGDGLAPFASAVREGGVGGGAKRSLLLFENSVAPNIKQVLEGAFDAQHIVCDRICTGREPSSDYWSLATTNEPFGEFVATPAIRALDLFEQDVLDAPCTGQPADLGPSTSASGHSPVFKTVQNELQLLAYKNRKRFLMNGIHYVLTLLAAQSCKDRKIKRFHEVPVFLAEALLDKASNLQLRSSINVFVECQIVRLMLEPAPNDLAQTLLKKAFSQYEPIAVYEHLRLFAEFNRTRIGGVTDLLKRLIQPDTSKRPKEFDRFREHVSTLAECFQAPGMFDRIRKAGLPFRFSQRDVALAVEVLKESEQSVYGLQLGSS